MTDDERTAILEDEVLILRDSGEIPEIAYHSVLHYLTQDTDGPLLSLTRQELEALQDAALSRYQEIVLRDINPDNRDLSSYRGIRRTLYNWQRMQDFCERIGRDCSHMTDSVRSSFLAFLEQEVVDVSTGRRETAINCPAAMLAEFAITLGISLAILPEGWRNLCSVDGE
jgi:hypothetical protein